MHHLVVFILQQWPARFTWSFPSYFLIIMKCITTEWFNNKTCTELFILYSVLYYNKRYPVRAMVLRNIYSLFDRCRQTVLCCLLLDWGVCHTFFSKCNHILTKHIFLHSLHFISHWMCHWAIFQLNYANLLNTWWTVW